MKTNTLKIALPAGSLKDLTLQLFKKAGFKISVPDRSYVPAIDDSELECMLIRAQEIPRYVAQGKFDLGLTGQDWIEETQVTVTEISELNYSKRGFNPVKLVIAVPANSSVKTIADLEGKTIATELVTVTNAFLKKNGVTAQVEYSWGATEAKTPYLADAIAELSESGDSLKANNLRVIAEIMQSTTRVIANTESVKDSWKKNKMAIVATLLKSALDAEGMVGLKLNIPKKQLKTITQIIPGLRKPTIAQLSDTNWCSVEVIVPESTVKTVIPKLIEYGAEGIVEYPLNKIIY